MGPVDIALGIVLAVIILCVGVPLVAIIVALPFMLFWGLVEMLSDVHNVIQIFLVLTGVSALYSAVVLAVGPPYLGPAVWLTGSLGGFALAWFVRSSTASPQIDE